MVITVPATGTLPTCKRSLISSQESNVVAIKDFKAVYRCFSCKGEIECKSAYKGSLGLLVTCPTCSAVFLVLSSLLSNECMVLLVHNHQWYSANSAVSMNMTVPLFSLPRTPSLGPLTINVGFQTD